MSVLNAHDYFLGNFMIVFRVNPAPPEFMGARA
jgi:hypothetical protein